MDRLRASSKTISLRNWRRPSAAAAFASSAVTSDDAPRPKTSRYRSEGILSFNPLAVDASEATRESSGLPSMPDDTCIVLKYLVDFLLKNKLHKNDLFSMDGKPSEINRLMTCLRDGDLPERLSQYSSRSVSHAILRTIAHTYAPLFPHDSYDELLLSMNRGASIGVLVTHIARVVQSGMGPERRAAFESLLTLLYRLSLKETAKMNPSALGKLVGTRLLSNSIDQDESQLVISLGQFLVEHAHEIVEQRQSLSRSHVDNSTSPYNPTRKPSAAALSSAALIIGRVKSGGQNSGYPKECLPGHSRQKKLLDEASCHRVSAVLTAILESPQSKKGLFDTELVRQDIAVSEFLRGSKSAVTLSTAGALELACELRSYLEEEVCPLLDGFVLSTSSKLENQALSTNGHDEDQIVYNLQTFILQELPISMQDTVILMLAVVQLGIDAGSIVTALSATLAPIFFASPQQEKDPSSASSWCQILFAKMSHVLEPIMLRRSRDAAIRRMKAAFFVALWVVSCRRKLKQRRQEKLRGTRPWPESVASTLCEIVEMLLDQTRAYPSQLRGLYLGGGNEIEVNSIIDQLCANAFRVTAETITPHSAALAVRRVLSSILRPLGTEPAETKLLARLKQLLLEHLDLLLLHEPLVSARNDLEYVFNEMIAQEQSEHEGLITGSGNLDKAQTQHEDTVPARDNTEQVNVLDKSNNEILEPSVADTLSLWLASAYTEASSGWEVKSQSGISLPAAFPSDCLELLQECLSDILFVMLHVRKRASLNQAGLPQKPDAEGRLFMLLSSLGIPPVLVPHERAAATLHRIQQVNCESQVPTSQSLELNFLEDFEILETLVLEAQVTLRHPFMAPLYPTPYDQLSVLLNVWGLADRTIVMLDHVQTKSL